MASAEEQAGLDPAAALLRWRLVLGPEHQPGRGRAGAALWAEAEAAVGADGDLSAVDRALDFLYGPEPDSDQPRGANLGASNPYLPDWLGDIRRHFPREVVAFLEKEAIDRRGLKELLLQPETLATLIPDIDLVATILGFKHLMPEATRQAARQIIAAVVEELRRKLEQQTRQAVTGALRRNQHAPLPVARNLDVRRTIRSGLRHYQPDLGKLIPERVYFYANRRRYHEWRVIILVDQSGSMATSLVHAGVIAAVFAGLPALDTRLILFDTAVADFSDRLGDPVELLLGVQLGGGTDIARAVAYGSSLVAEPEKTLFLLISDLEEGGDRAAMLGQLAALKESRVKVLCVLAINDRGTASFDQHLARQVAALDIPAFAATPGRLVEAVARALRGEALGGGL